MNKEKLIELLSECASEIYTNEYSCWYNANTMRSFEEWRSSYTKSLIEACYKTINELERVK